MGQLQEKFKHPDNRTFKTSNGDPAVVPTPRLQPTKQHLKILILGDFATGKTSLIKRHLHKAFSENYKATIGIVFDLHIYENGGNNLTRLQFWDVAGQEMCAKMFYKRTAGAFIVFDLTRPKTFESVARWKVELDSCIKLEDGSPIPCILLANKCDESEQQSVFMKPSEMDAYCRENGFVAWHETSAKENINIDVAVNAMVAEIIEGNARGNQIKAVNIRVRNKSKDCFCNIM